MIISAERTQDVMEACVCPRGWTDSGERGTFYTGEAPLKRVLVGYQVEHNAKLHGVYGTAGCFHRELEYSGQQPVDDQSGLHAGV